MSQRSVQAERMDAPGTPPGSEEGNGSHQDYPLLKQRVQDVHVHEGLRRLWLERRTLGIAIAVALAVAVFYLVGARSEYTAATTLMPERQSQSRPSIAGLDLLQQFGGMAGLSPDALVRPSNALSFDVYPEVLRSTPILLRLLEQPVRGETDGSTVPLETYLTEMEPASLWGAAGNALSRLVSSIGLRDRRSPTPVTGLDSSIVYVDTPTMRLVEELKGRIGASIDQKTGVLHVSASAADPQVSAQVARYAVDALTDYVTRYRIHKLEQNRSFIQGRYEEARTQMNAALGELARFRDQNQHLARNIARTEEQRLEAQYNLAFNVYSSLAVKLEEAKLRVQEQTPVFQVLQPVTVPISKSYPKTPLILFLALLGGLVAGSLLILSSVDLHDLKKTFGSFSR